MWQIHVATETRISKLREPEIEEVLRDFEARGLKIVSSRGAHPTYGDPDARSLARLNIESVLLINPCPPSGEPKILISQSWGVIGKSTSLPDALRHVLSRTDNQAKLAAVQADARHLYVHVHDMAAASGLHGVWPLPALPKRSGRRDRRDLALCPVGLECVPAPSRTWDRRMGALPDGDGRTGARERGCRRRLAYVTLRRNPALRAVTTSSFRGARSAARARVRNVIRAW